MRAYGRDADPSQHGDAGRGVEAHERRASVPREAVATALVASARHELRSPLQSIQGFAELLECQHYGSLSEEQQAFVKHILQGSSELGATLEASLELLELELGLHPLEPVRTDVAPLVGAALTRASELSGCVVRFASQSGLGTARASLDAAAIQRAVEALVVAMSPAKEPLGAQLTVEGEYACLRVTRVVGPFGAALRSIDELGAARRAGRGLVWLRLAATLVSRHDGVLTATDQAERAEVRLRLSSTH
ncbi:MAG: histidine kinase dimerization/phospho-acceptor domain-containing protein [Polyangiales bacterium]